MLKPQAAATVKTVLHSLIEEYVPPLYQKHNWWYGFPGSEVKHNSQINKKKRKEKKRVRCVPQEASDV